MIKPTPLRAPVPGGFTTDDFTIDFDARTVTCPANHTLPIPRSGGVGFKRRCRCMPIGVTMHHRCKRTQAHLSIHESQLRAARRQARDPEWQAEYRQHRPMVERSIAWLTRGNRKVRYRGVDQERPLAPPPRRRPKPAPTDHAGPDPHRHHLGHRLNPAAHGLATAQHRVPRSNGGVTSICRPPGLASNTRQQSASRHPAPTPLIQQAPRPCAPGPPTRSASAGAC